MKLSDLKPLVLALLPPLTQSYKQPQSQFPIATPATTSSLSIPLLGYGTWNLDRSNVSVAVSDALEVGYRHIDCAAAYGNQKDVGKGIALGLKKVGLRRSEIWVTSKLWNDHHKPDQVEKGLDQTLSDLGLDYLDLFLMHWPVASVNGKNKVYYVETWRAMEKLLGTGKVRHIGVSNFSPAQLKDLVENSNVKPFAHQMELHPYLPQSAWVQYHQSQSIHVTAYSPLGNANPIYDRPSKNTPPTLLKNSKIEEIAEKRGCTPATVTLAWGISRGTSVIPKSSHAERISENYGALECELEYEDFKVIEELTAKNLMRFNNPSESWGVPLYDGLDGA